MRQWNGFCYIRNHKLQYLTGYEAFLLQDFPKEYVEKVKNTVGNRHLLIQAGNAMTANAIQWLAQHIQTFMQEADYG